MHFGLSECNRVKGLNSFDGQCLGTMCTERDSTKQQFILAKDLLEMSQILAKGMQIFIHQFTISQVCSACKPAIN